MPPDDFGGGEGITLRDLISKIVATEVARYAARREERRLDRVLSPQQIDDGARAGAVRPEAREVPPPPPVEEAVGTALLAFEDDPDKDCAISGGDAWWRTLRRQVRSPRMERERAIQSW